MHADIAQVEARCSGALPPELESGKRLEMDKTSFCSLPK
jgi:hypothetical protein